MIFKLFQSKITITTIIKLELTFLFLFIYYFHKIKSGYSVIITYKFWYFVAGYTRIKRLILVVAQFSKNITKLWFTMIVNI